MELLEYQAKELFRQMGIPVLPSQRIDQPRDLKQLDIPYPVVLKSQVYTGGRGKAGGIRFVTNTIDAMAAAQSIFHLPIMGNYPSVLLAEAKYEADREFYLSVVLDTSTRRPLLLGSQLGGEAVEANLSEVQQVVVEQDFSPFYARRLAVQMGLKGELIQSVSQIVEKMYTLFSQKDLDLVEINPLAVSPTGKLMALDGKVAVNDAALGRHPDLVQLSPRFATFDPSARPSTAPLHLYAPDSHPGGEKDHALPNGASQPEAIAIPLKLVELGGNIGVICNGAGLAMTTLDLICAAKGKPLGFVDLGGEQHYGRSLEALHDRIEQGLYLMRQRPELKVILINILSGVISAVSVAEAIADCLKQPFRAPAPAIVVRLMGEEFAAAQAILAELEISAIESLDEAITQTIALAKPTRK
ncbi:ATP-grasp domain-containing protein [Egbenema bharatensis]|uniref:ATP-grasp domain-containing protein n=1 Tax=Egbenema bharatensis TaxID=3463334 RepID=UPI003A87F9BD